MYLPLFVSLLDRERRKREPATFLGPFSRLCVPASNLQIATYQDVPTGTKESRGRVFKDIRRHFRGTAVPPPFHRRSTSRLMEGNALGGDFRRSRTLILGIKESSVSLEVSFVTHIGQPRFFFPFPLKSVRARPGDDIFNAAAVCATFKCQPRPYSGLHI